jgi:hypothetical protein
MYKILNKKKLSLKDKKFLLKKDIHYIIDFLRPFLRDLTKKQ